MVCLSWIASRKTLQTISKYPDVNFPLQNQLTGHQREIRYFPSVQKYCTIKVYQTSEIMASGLVFQAKLQCNTKGKDAKSTQVEPVGNRK